MSLPPQKLSEIQKQAKQLQGQKWVSARELAVYREAVSNSSGSPPSSPPLSQPSTPKTEGTAARSELQQTGPHVSSSQRGSGVVASQGIEMEWEEPADHSPRAGDRDRCILDRVESLLSGDPHRRTVVGGGTEPPHQSAGATSCSLCPTSFPEACQRSKRAVEQQCHHSCVYQLTGRYKISNACQHRKRAVALVSSEKDSTQSSASSWQRESQYRFHVMPPEG